MEVSQFTYFQQVAGFECAPVSGELTYGLERLAMYVQGVENVYDLNFNGRDGVDKVTYGDVFLQAEREYSRHNFEHADTEMLFAQFRMAEKACQEYLEAGWHQEARSAPGATGKDQEARSAERATGKDQEAGSAPRVSPEASPRTGSGATGPSAPGPRHLMALPAYDQCIKASHTFNLLDARGVISVTERQSYILRVRELAKACGAAWLATEAGGAT
jgi:glycyl-tRNA synthetase alpha chain